MSSVFHQYGIFLLIPGIVLGDSILLRLAAGPHWLGKNCDPSYPYLVNGLRMVKGLVPNHVDHPGTPLQMLICTVCWLFNIGRSASDTVTHVFMVPEFYLHIVFVVLSLFSFAASVGLAGFVFRKTGDRLAAVLTQLPPLSFYAMRFGVENVCPDSLLISVGTLFNICLFMNFFAKTSKDEYAATLFWGFVCGLGVAVKLTFVPLLVIPLIVLSWKNKNLFLRIFAVSFFVWTLPIISRYPYLLKWIYQIFTHTGIYGSGGVGIIDIHKYCSSWVNIIVGQRAFVGFLFAASVLCFWKFARKKWDRGAFFLVATILGVLFQFAVVAKHPDTHYLLAGLGLFSALLALFYWQGPVRYVLGRGLVFVFILIFILIGTWRANEYRLNEARATKDVLAFYEHIHEKYKGFIFVGYGPSSGLESAFSFGDLYTGSFDELFRLYPNSFSFSIWANRIVNFKGRVLSNDLLAQYPGVIFQGDSDFDFSSTPFSVRLLEKGPSESIFLLTGTTEKQAIMCHLAAFHFFQTGDYGKALAWETRAKEFHYLP
jgi:hypothetical protein